MEAVLVLHLECQSFWAFCERKIPFLPHCGPINQLFLSVDPSSLRPRIHLKVIPYHVVVENSEFFPG